MSVCKYVCVCVYECANDKVEHCGDNVGEDDVFNECDLFSMKMSTWTLSGPNAGGGTNMTCSCLNNGFSSLSGNFKGEIG